MLPITYTFIKLAEEKLWALPEEEKSSKHTLALATEPWLKAAMAITNTSHAMRYASEGCMFIGSSQGLPLPYNCLWNRIDTGQCFLGSLVIPLSVHPGTET